ncbi:transmembrane protein (macronuclear) [Tetrahymena thermophila SB210]|uniref:Transmembrane protein n=1 Tax=Tetrahymena thermophila (strain SB210) TaxID=312017 RepID=Q245A0_TETTS|nr:transmembrane protein [Tetrahymena thermophila SB210]EAS03337.2 transmembrane protein [Tetrahymena thermophila SB210]|eukprot:XP_001023582.2 transmembrane protein [Tetrahymena thermophila SB210]
MCVVSQDIQIIDLIKDQIIGVTASFIEKQNYSTNQINSINYDENSNLVLSCSKDGKIIVWNMLDPLNPIFYSQIIFPNQQCLKVLMLQSQIGVGLLTKSIILFNMRVYLMDSNYNMIFQDFDPNLQQFKISQIVQLGIKSLVYSFLFNLSTSAGSLLMFSNLQNQLFIFDQDLKILYQPYQFIGNQIMHIYKYDDKTYYVLMYAPLYNQGYPYYTSSITLNTTIQFTHYYDLIIGSQMLNVAVYQQQYPFVKIISTQPQSPTSTIGEGRFYTQTQALQRAKKISTPNDKISNVVTNKQKTVYIMGSTTGSLIVIPENKNSYIQQIYQMPNLVQGDSLQSISQNFNIGLIYYVSSYYIFTYNLHTQQYYYRLDFVNSQQNITSNNKIQQIIVYQSPNLVLAFSNQLLILKNEDTQKAYQISTSNQNSQLTYINGCAYDYQLNTILVYGNALLQYTLDLIEYKILSQPNQQKFQACLFQSIVTICQMNSNQIKSIVLMIIMTTQHVIAFTSLGAFIFSRQNLILVTSFQPPGATLVKGYYFSEINTLAYITNEIRYGQVKFYSLDTLQSTGSVVSTFPELGIGTLINIFYDSANSAFIFADTYGNFYYTLYGSQLYVFNVIGIYEFEQQLISTPIGFFVDFRTNQITGSVLRIDLLQKQFMINQNLGLNDIISKIAKYTQEQIILITKTGKLINLDITTFQKQDLQINNDILQNINAQNDLKVNQIQYFEVDQPNDRYFISIISENKLGAYKLSDNSLIKYLAFPDVQFKYVAKTKKFIIIFFKNVASASGGSLYLLDTSNITIDQNTKFKNNVAQIGGAMRILYSQQMYQRYLYSFKTIQAQFDSNLGQIYGHDIGTYPYQYLIYQGNDFNKKSLIYTGQLFNIDQDNLILQNIQSGGSIKLFLQLQDQYNQSVIINKQSFMSNFYPSTLIQELQKYSFEILSNSTKDTIEIKGDSISNLHSYDQISNSFLFDNLQISGFPLYQITSTFLQIKVNDWSQNITLNITSNFRNCKKGEYYYQVSKNIVNCVQCSNQTYSLLDPIDATNITIYDKLQQNISNYMCKKCPEGSESCYSDIIILQQGYWRENNQTDAIFQCNLINPDICDPTKQNGCMEGHIGPLCETCDYFGVVFKGNTYSQSMSTIECKLITQDQIQQSFKMLTQTYSQQSPKQSPQIEAPISKNSRFILTFRDQDVLDEKISMNKKENQDSQIQNKFFKKVSNPNFDLKKYRKNIFSNQNIEEQEIPNIIYSSGITRCNSKNVFQ